MEFTQSLIKWNLPNTLLVRIYYPNFTEEETEAQRDSER